MVADSWMGVTRDRMRAADRDREEVAETLRRAYAEGRLDAAEFGERTSAVYAARTWGEVRELAADIPPPDPDIGLPSDFLRKPKADGVGRLFRRPRWAFLLVFVMAIICVLTGATARTAATLLTIAILVLSVSVVRSRR